MAIHSVELVITATGDPNEAAGVAETTGIVTGELIDVQVNCVGATEDTSFAVGCVAPDTSFLSLTGAGVTGVYAPIRQQCDKAGAPLSEYTPWLLSSKLFAAVDYIAEDGYVTTVTVRYKD